MGVTAGVLSLDQEDTKILGTKFIAQYEATPPSFAPKLINGFKSFNRQSMLDRFIFQLPIDFILFCFSSSYIICIIRMMLKRFYFCCHFHLFVIVARNLNLRLYNDLSIMFLVCRLGFIIPQAPTVLVHRLGFSFFLCKYYLQIAYSILKIDGS